MCATSAVIRAFKKVETFNVCMYSVPLIIFHSLRLQALKMMNWLIMTLLTRCVFNAYYLAYGVCTFV